MSDIDPEFRNKALNRAAQSVQRVVAAHLNTWPEHVQDLVMLAEIGDAGAFSRKAQDITGEASSFAIPYVADLAALAREIADAPEGPRKAGALRAAARAVLLGADPDAPLGADAARLLRENLSALLAALNANTAGRHA